MFNFSSDVIGNGLNGIKAVLLNSDGFLPNPIIDHYHKVANISTFSDSSTAQDMPPKVTPLTLSPLSV